MDPEQVVRDEDGVMRCTECGFRYNLSAHELAESAERGLQSVHTAVNAVSSERRSTRPSPKVWSVNAYVLHLSQAAEMIVWRMQRIVADDHPPLPYHEQDEAVVEGGGDAVSTETSLPVLDAAVTTYAGTARTLPPEAWTRVGVHARAGEVSLSDIAHDMGHELHHHALDIQRMVSR